MAPSPRVLLVHGIWNARFWLEPFARRLRAAGYAPELFGYASVFGTPERAAERLRARLRSDPVPFLVGHSLGGLIALEALQGMTDTPVRRVVCLGSPLRGSRTAGTLAERPPLSLMLGQSKELLRNGCRPWSGPAEVGVVAGNVPRGIGRIVAGLDEASDGTVAVAETRLEGLHDHCIVPTSHTGLVLSADVARQTTAFLDRGRFDR